MSREVRVLQLITRFLDSGGAETMTEDVIAALKEDEQIDYEIHFGHGADYSPARLSSIAKEIENIVCFSSIRHFNPITPPIAVIAVVRYLRKHEIDIIHTRSTEAGIIGRWAGYLAGTPIIIHGVRGIPFSEEHHDILNGFVQVLERISAPLADRLVADSKTTRDYFLEQSIGNPDQFEIISPGIPIEEFIAANGKEVGQEERPTILFVGRLERPKGVYELIEAFERIHKKYDVDLALVGEGDEEGLKKSIHRDIRAKVHVLGYRKDIPQLMAGADILVHPSHREGFSRVVTEAMAAGLPVVASPVGGIPDRVTDGEQGYLVEQGEIDQLAAQLETLLESCALREEMGAKAQNGIGDYSVDSVKEKYQDLYRELIEEELA